MDYLRDLYAHQHWADAEHWLAIEAHAPAREDAAILQRLHHIHLVQHAFLSIVQDQQVEFVAFSEFPTFVSLQAYARDAAERARALWSRADPAFLQRRLAIQWFKDPPLEITVEQALLQAAMHSHYHRGQNATRFRELGGEPPLTDLIVWYWKGRPVARW